MATNEKELTPWQQQHHWTATARLFQVSLVHISQRHCWLRLALSAGREGKVKTQHVQTTGDFPQFSL